MSRRRSILRLTTWATLAAALLVAVVWAGGHRTLYIWTMRHKPIPIQDHRMLLINGWLGGLEIEWVHGSGWRKETRFEFPTYLYRWMWTPSFASVLGGGWRWCVPYWIPTLLFGSVSGSLFWLDRRATRRAKVSHCPACGYSLAGLPASSACPECGK